jgi:hypothetical protein
MTTRIIREDDKGPYVSINGQKYRPEFGQFVASAKKRVGLKVGVQVSASRLFGTIVFLTVPDVKSGMWAWRPEKYVGAKQPDPTEFNKAWEKAKAQILNSDKPTAETLLGMIGTDYLKKK